MPKSASNARARANLKAAVANKDASAGACKWCDPRSRRLTTAAEGRGLNRSMCRVHADHLSRHGHALKPSYKATAIRPLERVVRKHLKRTLKVSDPVTRATLSKVRNVVLSGREDGDQSLPRSATEKASAILGRLYSKYCGERPQGVRTRWPRRLSPDELALSMATAVIALELAQTLDPAPASNDRYLQTQIGKLVFRRAGGWHRRREREDVSKTEYRQDEAGSLKAGPALYRDELNRYGASRGRALVTVGNRLRDAAAALWSRDAEALERAAREAACPPIENWTMHRDAPAAKGGARRRPRARNPLRGPHDKTTKLTRALP